MSDTAKTKPPRGAGRARNPGGDGHGAAGGGEQGGKPPAPPAPPAPYVVLARKYRPKTFDDLIGQGAMVRTLANAFTLGRIAQAFMLTGIRGVGKTTTARILARALNYEPLGAGAAGPTVVMPELGAHCQAIMESRHPDVMEVDAASNTGIDNIRDIIEAVQYRPQSARFKVYIIDEVHMLSKGAFNALLKTLEEPPPHVKFIFATTEIRKVPVTVLSRCQRFDLRRVSVTELTAHFARVAALEGASVSDEALVLIARAAEGSVRDGLSLLDQALAHGQGRVEADQVRAMLGLADAERLYDLAEAVLDGQAGPALVIFAGLHHDGAEPQAILVNLAEALHAVSKVKVAGPVALAGLSETERARVCDLAEHMSVGALARAWQMLVKGLAELATAPLAYAAAEMILIRMAHAALLPSPEEVIAGLRVGQTPAIAQPGTVAHVSPARDERSPDEPTPAAAPPLKTFADVVRLVAEHRDLKLKIQLEDMVRPVSIRPGTLEIALLPDAPRGLVNELATKLSRWTGERWMVIVSHERGENSLQETQQERWAAEEARVRNHPLIKEILAEFPGAEIAPIEDADRDIDDE